MELKNHIGLDGEAARWHARMLAEDCTESERAALRCWREYDPRHNAAYERVEAALKRIDSAASETRMQALAQEAFDASRAESKKDAPNRMWPAAMAASLALASLGVFYSMRSEQVIPVGYQTGVERSTIVLADGSVAQLDVATRITVRMTDGTREIKLLNGRAVFDVAHDVERPFSVDADGLRTVALGTRFQVQRDGDLVSILLEQGSVAVERRNESHVAVWSERLSPGEQVVVDSHSGTRSKSVIDPQIATSWTHDRHVFRATRLEDAVAEINRYARRKVRIGDPDIADLQIAGNFIAGDSEQIMTAIASVLPLRLVEAGEHEIVLFRRYSDTERSRP